MTAQHNPLEFTLVGERALVTGAAGGMGRAITAALLAAGATSVVGWDRVLVDSPSVDSRIVDLGDSAPDTGFVELHEVFHLEDQLAALPE